MTSGAVVASDFTDFVVSAEPRLRLALGTAYGFERAQDATADALAFAWENWDRVSNKDNPIGFVFGVGRNRIRNDLRRPRTVFLPPVRITELPWIEPGLPPALTRLSLRQRQVVMLLHCFEWTIGEVAEVLDLSRGAVQEYDRRGLARLRSALGVH